MIVSMETLGMIGRLRMGVWRIDAFLLGLKQVILWSCWMKSTSKSTSKKEGKPLVYYYLIFRSDGNVGCKPVATSGHDLKLISIDTNGTCLVEDTISGFCLWFHTIPFLITNLYNPLPLICYHNVKEPLFFFRALTEYYAVYKASSHLFFHQHFVCLLHSSYFSLQPNSDTHYFSSNLWYVLHLLWYLSS